VSLGNRGNSQREGWSVAKRCVTGKGGVGNLGVALTPRISFHKDRLIACEGQKRGEIHRPSYTG